MVRAIIDGRKTQTRRIVMLPRWAEACNEDHEFEIDGEPPWPHAISRVSSCLAPIECPYGWPGDQLWVRETCRAYEVPDGAEGLAFAEKYDWDTEFPPYGLDGVIYKADEDFRQIKNTAAASDAWARLNSYRGKSGSTVPPIHMPRWASRLTLRITAVRVEQLQEISKADAIAEGIERVSGSYFRVYEKGTEGEATIAIPSYRSLWESINGEGSWGLNPWVWVIEFERIEQQGAVA
jgi:hypothetical protein